MRWTQKRVATSFYTCSLLVIIHCHLLLFVILGHHMSKAWVWPKKSRHMRRACKIRGVVKKFDSFNLNTYVLYICIYYISIFLSLCVYMCVCVYMYNWKIIFSIIPLKSLWKWKEKAICLMFLHTLNLGVRLQNVA